MIAFLGAGYPIDHSFMARADRPGGADGCGATSGFPILRAMNLYVGIDVGTSGCRAIAINGAGDVVAQRHRSFPAAQRNGPCCEQDPQLWLEAVYALLAELRDETRGNEIAAIAVDGTSGTLLLTDANGVPIGPALMYNDARSVAEADRIAAHAPADSGAHGASSSLAKLLHLEGKLGRQAGHQTVRHAVHQAEWIAGCLTGRHGIGDENNCLKLGYDVVRRCWPQWLEGLLGQRSWLPTVVAPGSVLGTLSTPARRRTGLPATTQVVAGTTDGVAAFVATGAKRPGEAVTSLGSTLVLKIIAQQPVFAPQHGVYSHRLGERWLAGGASNSGGAVLAQYFTPEQLLALSPAIDGDTDSGLDYYPLPAPGERFPLNDPTLLPRLSPRPPEPARFLHGLLEGIAHIELLGYQTLAKLGAPYPENVRTVGGGAGNPTWTGMRARLLQVPLLAPRHREAAYGAALLAAGLPDLADVGPTHAIA